MLTREFLPVIGTPPSTSSLGERSPAVASSSRTGQHPAEPTAVQPAAEHVAATSAGSTEQAALLAHVPPAYSTQCRKITKHSFPVIAKDLTIALRCDLLSGQPDGVEYYQYESTEAMKKAFDGFFESGERGGCMTAPGTDRWRVAGNDETLGVLHCYNAENGQINYVWTREDMAIMGWTYSTSLSYPAMYAFWTTAGPF